MPQRNKSLTIVAVLILALVFGLALWYASGQIRNRSQAEIPPAGEITIEGRAVCLPRRDTSGPQTLECALGLKDDQNRHFALRDSDPSYGNVSGLGTEERVEIVGTFIPQEDGKYVSIGIIEVKSSRKLNSDDFVILNLPNDVHPEQIQSKYSTGDKVYAFAMQPNSNFNFPALSGKSISWHGVLRTSNNGESWDKFFSIEDPVDPDNESRRIKYNPVGGFAQNGKTFIDIADDRGAGSGEGHLLRFSTNDDGQTWSQDSCYYFIPEKYYPDYGQGRTDTVSPHDLEPSEECVY